MTTRAVGARRFYALIVTAKTRSVIVRHAFEKFGFGNESFSKRFFRIRIPTGLYGFNRMQGVLKIGRADKDRIYILVAVEFFVVDVWRYIMCQLLLEESLPFFAAQLPDIGNSNNVKVQLLVKEGNKDCRKRSE